MRLQSVSGKAEPAGGVRAPGLSDLLLLLRSIAGGFHHQREVGEVPDASEPIRFLVLNKGRAVEVGRLDNNIVVEPDAPEFVGLASRRNDRRRAGIWHSRN